MAFSPAYVAASAFHSYTRAGPFGVSGPSPSMGSEGPSVDDDSTLSAEPISWECCGRTVLDSQPLWKPNLLLSSSFAENSPWLAVA